MPQLKKSKLITFQTYLLNLVAGVRWIINNFDIHIFCKCSKITNTSIPKVAFFHNFAIFSKM